MMNAATILCPGCGTQIEALHEQFRHENEARLALLVGKAEQKAREDAARDMRLVAAQLAEERRKREESQRAELELRKQKSALEDRARELDLEVARRLDAEKASLEEAVRSGFAAQRDLKREQLIAVAFAQGAAEGRHEKMEFLYRYLAGDRFCRRIEAMVEAFAALQSGLNRERTAMERIWKEREKQIERVLANTAGLYGEVRGIIGSSVPPLPALELGAVAGLPPADGAQ
jgi:hypothetical protein